VKKVLVIGSLNMDFVVNVDKELLPGETKIANSFALVPGGKGANQAYALGKLDADVSMIGLVGEDIYGDLLINNLKSVNVATESIQKLKDENTGNAFITVDNTGQNRIVVVSGANQKITKEYIDKNLDLIKESDIIVMQLEIPLDVVIYIADICKQYNKFVVLDPAPAIPMLPQELLRNIDIIKPNETELKVISGIDINSEEDIVNAGKELIKKGVKNVIVTLGENGSYLINDKIQKFEAIKVSEVIDTTGAGDSFNAGLIKSLLNDKSLEEAIQFGHIVSSLVVRKKGAQTSIPTILEVNEYIEKENL